MISSADLTAAMSKPPGVAMLATAGVIGVAARTAGASMALWHWAHTSLDVALVSLAAVVQVLGFIAIVGLVTHAITAGHRDSPVGILLLWIGVATQLPMGFVDLVVRDGSLGLLIPIFEIVAGFLGAAMAADIFIRWVSDRPRPTIPEGPATPAGERAGGQLPWGR